MIECKIWADGSMMFGDVFLCPLQIKYLANWFNLHIVEIRERGFVGVTKNEDLELIVCSLNGITFISTGRDFGFFSNEQLTQIKKFINDHREVVGCQEVV